MKMVRTGMLTRVQPLVWPAHFSRKGACSRLPTTQRLCGPLAAHGPRVNFETAGSRRWLIGTGSQDEPFQCIATYWLPDRRARLEYRPSTHMSRADTGSRPQISVAADSCMLCQACLA